MTAVLEARRRFDAARDQAKEMVDRERALLGMSMIRARTQGGESQTTIAAKLGVGPQQVREYERAYREWVREHDGQEPTEG